MKISAHFKQKNGGDPTIDWQLARVGIVTASEMDALITPLGKVRMGEGVETYLCKKLAERWIGGPLGQFFTNFAVEQGNILEEQAIPFAELEYDLKIEQVGFVATDDGLVGCSPDGLIGFNPANFDKVKVTDYKLGVAGESGIEIKCPQLETHIKYLLAGELPKDYVAQVQGSMWVTGCATWHFLSYRRNFPALHLVIERDEKFQDALTLAVELFQEQFDAALKRLIEINGGPPNPKHRGAVPFLNPKPVDENPDLIP
jgi:YqaJ-like viral recombinase domain